MSLAVIRKKNITSHVAGEAITADTIVVSNAAGTVIKGANANDANIEGIAIAAADNGSHVDVAGTGDRVWCLAGAAITYGARLIVGDSSGRAIVCPETAGNIYNIVGYARGTCSNAGEKVPVLIAIHTHTKET